MRVCRLIIVIASLSNEINFHVLAGLDLFGMTVIEISLMGIAEIRSLAPVGILFTDQN